MHVAGNLFSQVGWSFGIGLSTLKNYRCNVDYTAFDVGRATEGYFTNPAYTNKDINSAMKPGSRRTRDIIW